MPGGDPLGRGPGTSVREKLPATQCVLPFAVVSKANAQPSTKEGRSDLPVLHATVGNEARLSWRGRFGDWGAGAARFWRVGGPVERRGVAGGVVGQPEALARSRSDHRPD